MIEKDVEGSGCSPTYGRPNCIELAWRDWGIRTTFMEPGGLLSCSHRCGTVSPLPCSHRCGTAPPLSCVGGRP
jgi:hypothetical protein